MMRTRVSYLDDQLALEGYLAAPDSARAMPGALLPSWLNVNAKGSHRKRAMPIGHEQISVVIDGRSIVEAYTKRRLLHDFVIRHRQVLNIGADGDC